MLELVGITKRYDGITAVDALSLRIEPGGIFGLLGPNGAGKTTTIRMIMGVIEPDEGEVRIFGEPFSERIKDSIGYLPEERGLYRKMKVLDHLVFLGEIKSVPAGVARARGKKWLERLDLGGWADKTVESLSKGMQQKVQFIATVLHEPKLVLLDEPFTGLDPINTEIFKEIIEELQQDGRAVVLSTHVMEQVEKLCKRICLINKGKKDTRGFARRHQDAVRPERRHASVLGGPRSPRAASGGRARRHLRPGAHRDARGGHRHEPVSPPRSRGREGREIRDRGDVAPRYLHREGEVGRG